MSKRRYKEPCASERTCVNIKGDRGDIGPAGPAGPVGPMSVLEAKPCMVDGKQGVLITFETTLGPIDFKMCPMDDTGCAADGC